MSTKKPGSFNIKLWKESDRPREKLMEHGSAHLTDSELLAILIGHGNREENAVELCQRIMHSVNHDLVILSRMTVSDLMKFKGIGEAKAVSITAALELGRRRQRSDLGDHFRISTSSDVYHYLKSHMEDLNHEEFWILLLDRSNKVIGQEMVSKGGVAGTVVDAKLIFKPAIERFASHIILSHNHPSGNLNPSEQDISLTKKLKQAGQHLDITVLDHVIITAHGYYSFSDEGRL